MNWLAVLVFFLSLEFMITSNNIRGRNTYETSCVLLMIM